METTLRQPKPRNKVTKTTSITTLSPLRLLTPLLVQINVRPSKGTTMTQVVLIVRNTRMGR